MTPGRSLGQAIPFRRGGGFSFAAGEAPTLLTATTFDDTQIDLTWTDNSTHEDGYSIERSDDGITFVEIGTVLVNIVVYSDTTCVEGTLYYYRVRAYKGIVYSVYSNTASATTVLNAPTLLTATTISDVRIDLAWTDNSTNEEGYSIERGTDGINFVWLNTVLTDVTTYNDSSCVTNTLYYYRVRAFRGAVWSDYSNIASATTLWTWVIPIAGQTTGTATAGTMVISCTEDITITKTGDVTISVVQAADSIYRKHTVTINCPNNGSGTVVIPDRTKVVSLGNHGGASNPTINFYTGTNTTAPILTWNLNNIPATCLKIRQATSYTVILPTTGNTAFSTILTYLYLVGTNIAWTYTGALPTGLTGLQFVGVNINWTYTGALPTGLILLQLNGNDLNWTYTGALPTGLTYLYLVGNIINWTGLDISGTGNIATFNLSSYRIAKMSSADMVTLLTNLTNRVGGLPATITINDYLDFAAPPVEVTDAVAALKLAKSITTVNLGA